MTPQNICPTLTEAETLKQLSGTLMWRWCFDVEVVSVDGGLLATCCAWWETQVVRGE